MFGLAVDDVDFFGHWLLVNRQVKLIAGKPVLAQPKGGKTREVPLSEVVAFALAERLRGLARAGGHAAVARPRRRPGDRKPRIPPASAGR